MNLEKLLFYATVLLLPTQLGRHFWPDFAFVEGIRIDYLSPTLYLTDILIGLLFILWIFPQFSRFGIRKKKSIIHNSLFIIFSLILLLIGNILLSLSPIAGFYKLTKVVEFAFFGFYVATQINLKKELATIVTMLVVGLVFESSLAILQFLKQASVGGMFWFFGERMFSGQTPGIANTTLDGRLVLRPYGTFSHPNVLAGFLVIAMTTIVQNAKFKVQSLREITFLVSLLLGSITLFLTLSRVTIILWLLVVVVLLRKKLFTFHFVLLTLVITAIISQTPLSSRFTSVFTTDHESLTRRHELNIAAIEMVKTSPVFGVGLNNFLVQLPSYQQSTSGPLWLQPVHNIYLLIAAETGIVGLGFFLWLVGKTFHRIRKKKFIILSSVLVLGFFDHYFLTLQQGQMLLALVFGLAWAKRL